jgi:hypothetical protein
VSIIISTSHLKSFGVAGGGGDPGMTGNNVGLYHGIDSTPTTEMMLACIDFRGMFKNAIY